MTPRRFQQGNQQQQKNNKKKKKKKNKSFNNNASRGRLKVSFRKRNNHISPRKSNKKIAAALKRSIKNSIFPSEEFVSSRTFTANAQNLDIKVSTTDDNVSRDLQGLNLQDESTLAASIIEIPDSPAVASELEPGEIVEDSDVVCLDDNNSNSDVVLVGNKRKSSFGVENQAPKKRKTSNSIVIIDDDDDSQLPVLHKKKKKKKMTTPKTKRVTRLSSVNFAHTFLATSTPNQKNARSYLATPNLATIPEEQQKTFHRTLSFLRNNSFDALGTNFLNAGDVRTHGLRPIFIDGSNVAMRHSNGKFFSVKGLKICIDYFLKKGHEVTAVVPMFRKKRSQNSDPGLLKRLENRGLVVFTPARTINGRHIVPYDDRYVILMAAVHKGVVVSSDNYRDLLAENPQMAETIERRVLNPTWMKDMIIFPMDPLGRNGPSLEEFLRFP